MNKNSKNKKKYVRPTTAIVIATSGKILAFNSDHPVYGISDKLNIVIDEGVEDNAVSYSSRGSAVNNVWDEADSYDGDILMK